MYQEEDLKIGELLDKAKQGSNLLIQKVTDFMIRKRRLKECIDFLMPLLQNDPLIASHICDAFLSVDKSKEAILFLAEKIKEFPYLVPLLIKQSQAFIKQEFYEYGLKLARICVDLCPESFEAWFLLAENYFYVKKIDLVNQFL